MNKQLLRKLLAGLLVCAMLLASVVAFADDEAPAEPTTTPVEDTVDPSDSTDPVDPVTPAAPADSTDSADDVDENDDATVDEDEDDVDNDEDIVNNDEDIVNNDEDIVDNDEDNVDNDEDDVKDTENEENVDDEGKPVPPPINIGGVPNVEGTEGEGDDANTDNGISLLFFNPEHAHEHEYVEDPESPPEEYSDCEEVDEYQHRAWIETWTYYICNGCSDTKQECSYIDYYEDHYDSEEDNDTLCDACGYDMGDDADMGTASVGPCTHPDVDWELLHEEIVDTVVGISEAYDTKTDTIDKSSKKDGINKSAGHKKTVKKVYEGLCYDCIPTTEEDENPIPTWVEKTEYETIYEPHSFKNGKCTVCGYKKPASSTKKEEDTRVRMGTKLMQEIRALAADGATVNLYNENLVYTEAELASVQAISDPFERMLMMLAALGYGDEVEYAIKTQGLEVSGAALALIDQLGARPALPGAAAAFLSTEKVNGTDREVVTIALVVSGNGVVTKSFSFYKDGSNFYFFE